MRCAYRVAWIVAVWPAASTALTRKQRRGVPEPNTRPVAQTGSNGLLAPGNSTLYDSDEWQGTTPVFTPEEFRYLTEGTDGRQNLCVNGSLLPEVMVVGAIKAGTTTFCSSLRYSPSMLFPRAQRRWEGSEKYPANWKEGHFFDKHAVDGMSYLLKGYGACNRSIRLIGVDGTAKYSVEHNVPITMKAWYRDLAWRLKFIVIMREPVSRLHSHYYHALEMNWCSLLEAKLFRAVALELLSAPPLQWTTSPYATLGVGCRAFIEGSIYTRLIYTYFQSFGPYQFTFVPYRYNVAPGESSRNVTHPAQTLWERLGARGFVPPLLHSNDRVHRRLTRDLGPAEIVRLQAWFNVVTGPRRIARMLYNTTAVLHGFNGARSIESISAWIAYNW